MGAIEKPKLTFGRIVLMNLGFLGLQFSFGLQQGNMGPIYSYLGAHEAALPLLSLAGPVTGLLVQPVVGALSDRTVTRWGRRVPYFIVGAVLCSVGLFAMPYSSSILMAALLLWILDAANNVTMEPYRAYVSDRLGPEQRELGFLTQSSFTGLAQTLAYVAPSLLVFCGISRDALGGNGIPEVTKAAFVIGAVISIGTILWSVIAVPELPQPAADIARMRAEKAGVGTMLRDIAGAVREMPEAMRRMAWMSLFQWYAMMCYWSYVIYSIGRSVYGTSDSGSAGFRQAVLTNGQIGAFYNLVACGAAFAMVPIAKHYGARPVHAVCLAASGCAMLVIPQVHGVAWLFPAVVGIGLGWGSIMGNPYVMLANSIPAARTGVYMGIFNMFIVLPMMLFAVTMPLMYDGVLGGDPRHVLELGGVLMFAAAASTLRIRLAAPCVAVAG
jgi:maltose/moltooligosaccharide transporter